MVYLRQPSIRLRMGKVRFLDRVTPEHGLILRVSVSLLAISFAFFLLHVYLIMQNVIS